jgi:hypothetical protein
MSLRGAGTKGVLLGSIGERAPMRFSSLPISKWLCQIRKKMKIFKWWRRKTELRHTMKMKKTLNTTKGHKLQCSSK